MLITPLILFTGIISANRGHKNRFQELYNVIYNQGLKTSDSSLPVINPELAKKLAFRNKSQDKKDELNNSLSLTTKDGTKVTVKPDRRGSFSCVTITPPVSDIEKPLDPEREGSIYYTAKILNELKTIDQLHKQVTRQDNQSIISTLVARVANWWW